MQRRQGLYTLQCSLVGFGAQGLDLALIKSSVVYKKKSRFQGNNYWCVLPAYIDTTNPHPGYEFIGFIVACCLCSTEHACMHSGAALYREREREGERESSYHISYAPSPHPAT